MSMFGSWSPPQNAPNARIEPSFAGVTAGDAGPATRVEPGFNDPAGFGTTPDTGGRSEPPMARPDRVMLNDGATPTLDARPTVVGGKVVYDTEAPLTIKAGPAPEAAPTATTPKASAAPWGARPTGPWGSPPTAETVAPAVPAVAPAAPAVEQPGMLSRVGQGMVQFGLGRLPVIGAVYGAYEMGKQLDRDIIPMTDTDRQIAVAAQRAPDAAQNAIDAAGPHATPATPPGQSGRSFTIEIPDEYKPAAFVVGAIGYGYEKMDHAVHAIENAPHRIVQGLRDFKHKVQGLATVGGDPVVPEPVAAHEEAPATPVATPSPVTPPPAPPHAGEHAAPVAPAGAQAAPQPATHSASPPVHHHPHHHHHAGKAGHRHGGKAHHGGLKRAHAQAPTHGAVHAPDAPPHRVPGSVHFDSGSSTLNPTAQREVAFEAALLNSKAGGGPVHVALTGHTDATGGADQNNELAEARNAAVADELSKNGIIVDRKAAQTAAPGHHGSNADERRVDITAAEMATAKADGKAPVKPRASLPTP